MVLGQALREKQQNSPSSVSL